MSFLKISEPKPENVFRLFFWRFFFAYLPFGILIAILSLLEIRPIVFNDNPIFGIKAFILELLLIPLMALVITTMVWLFFMLGDSIIGIIVKLKGK